MDEKADVLDNVQVIDHRWTLYNSYYGYYSHFWTIFKVFPHKMFTKCYLILLNAVSWTLLLIVCSNSSFLNKWWEPRQRMLDDVKWLLNYLGQDSAPPYILLLLWSQVKCFPNQSIQNHLLFIVIWLQMSLCTSLSSLSRWKKSWT